MALTARALARSFGGIQAVADVSLVIEPGETLALIGASGCGKTTTLKLLNRLIEPDHGEVRLDGLEAHDVPAHEWRRRIGYVIQSGGLFPHLTVFGNVAVTPDLLGWPPARIRDKVNRLLDMVGLPAGEFAGRRPDALSGGQAQPVGLARALAGEPQFVLMDEPFSALDSAIKSDLIDDVARLRDELGFGAVIVTHDLSEALRFADRIAVMEGGRIVQEGEAETLIAQPGHAAVERLLDAPRRTAERVARAFQSAGAGSGGVSDPGADAIIPST